RQTHTGQRSDCNRLFSNFVMENYGTCVKGNAGAPVLGHQALDRHVIPLLKNGQKVILFVLSGMRLDQYIIFEQLLRELYSVKRHYFYSILPTVSSFTRNSFFAGKLPSEMVARYPQLLGADNNLLLDSEEMLLADKLKECGLGTADPLLFIKGISGTETKSIVKKIKNTSSLLVPVVLDINNFLLDNASGMIQDLTNDESGLRELTKSWFLRSAVFTMLKEFAGGNHTIILTSDHGTTFCSRGTELYGVETEGKNLRYCIGKDISTDERNAIFLDDPTHFGLPVFNDGSSIIIAKENYYFVPPDKFEFYRKHYKTTFQDGGISMDEIIMPVGILTGRETV
ncbi:MAG: PglZ domain-containing protein, partial [Fibrobacter sp.]|nr:PglZ domain-containing protein [Fibrobacter sp.]